MGVIELSDGWCMVVSRLSVSCDNPKKHIYVSRGQPFENHRMTPEHLFSYTTSHQKRIN